MEWQVIAEAVAIGTAFGVIVAAPYWWFRRRSPGVRADTVKVFAVAFLIALSRNLVSLLTD